MKYMAIFLKLVLNIFFLGGSMISYLQNIVIWGLLSKIGVFGHFFRNKFLKVSDFFHDVRRHQLSMISYPENVNMRIKGNTRSRVGIDRDGALLSSLF